VIVPAHQAEDVLPLSLGALLASDLERSRWELIVVDDGSSDRTSDVARKYADAVVRIPHKPRGPSYARNRGSEAASGENLVFIDADVCVHSDALGRFAELFARHVDVAAIFGSYDARPAAKGLVSQYRNVLHHYMHQRHAGDAETFWAGCGAVRTSVFLDVGMYDEWHYARPQIEDIELGRRIRRSGRRILLQPEIQATHLKRWTLRDVLRTDFLSRGVPWTRLIIQEGPEGGRSLNVGRAEKLKTALAGIAVLCVPAALATGRAAFVGVAIGAATVVVASSAPFYFVLGRNCGWGVALGALPLHFLYYVGNGLSAIGGWFMHFLVGPPLPPADVIAFDEIGVETWPPVPKRPKKSVWTPNGH